PTFVVVAAHLEPKDASEAAAILAQAITKTTDWDITKRAESGKLSGWAQSLAAVAPRLEPKEAAVLCNQATTTLALAMTKTTLAMTKTTDATPLLWLTQGWAAVAPWLEPQEAAVLCKEPAATITLAMTRTT